MTATRKRKAERHFCVFLLIAIGLLITTGLLAGCGRKDQRRIALIPRTTGSAFWEAEHSGALQAARSRLYTICWNAPQREDDVESQISLIERVTANHFDGLILAPDHSLAVLTSVRRALAAGISVVIVSSEVQLPPGAAVSYILSDDEQGGRMAAQRVALLLQNKGSVAVLGVDPDVIGIMKRLRSFELTLGTNYASIHVAAVAPGAFNAAETQEALTGILNQNPSLRCVLTLTTVSTRAAYYALKSSNRLGRIKLIGFEQDAEMLNAVGAGEIDSIVAESMFEMGFEAVRQMESKWRRQPVPQRTVLAPVLITRENVDSPQIRQLTRMNWFQLK